MEKRDALYKMAREQTNPQYPQQYSTCPWGGTTITTIL